MSLILRQSTSVVVSFGPFLDKTDGVALETGMVTSIDHATTGIFLSKNGGALAIRSQAVTASTYDAYGNYRVTLSTTDTNTIGTLRMQFSEAATCLPVWQDLIVVDELVYDVLFGTVAPATTTNITAGTIATVSGNVNGSVGSVTGAVGSVTGLTAATVHSDLDDIQARLPAALVGGKMDSDATAISGAAATADRLEAWMNGFVTGSAVGTPTSTVIDTDLTEATDDHYNHMILAFTGGALLGQARRISDYNGTTKEITVQPAFTEAPVATDTFIIVTIIVGGLDATGRMDVGSVAGTAQTAGDIIANLAVVDSNVDAILVDTAEIGIAGAGLTNINLPDQTMNITGDITGNLSGSVGSVTGAVGSVTGAVGSVTGAVGSVTGLTASDVGAIKTKTDSLTFTVAGKTDANVTHINETEVTGDGDVTPWGPV